MSYAKRRSVIVDESSRCRLHVIITILSNTMSLAHFSTCEISDALIKLSIPHGGYIPDVNTISPNARICGPAYTVQMVLAGSHTSGSNLSSHFVDTAPSGSIIVIDVPPGSVHRTYTR